MEKIEIKAVELTRRIREAHAEELRGATREDRIRFYREKAKQLDAILTRTEDAGSHCA